MNTDAQDLAFEEIQRDSYRKRLEGIEDLNTDSMFGIEPRCVFFPARWSESPCYI